MNGDVSTLTNSKVIHFVVGTVCLGAIACVMTQAYCYINKIPDMNTPLSSAFIHISDTLVGALLAMLVNTRPQSQQKPGDGDKPTVLPIVSVPVPEGPVEARITNPPSDPVPTSPQPPIPPKPPTQP